MSDRFPSIEDFDEGEPSKPNSSLPPTRPHFIYHFQSKPKTASLTSDSGQTEARPNNGPSADLMDGPSEDTSDFLSRERAALGDDANQFATPGDNVATTQNGDDDLLGGGGGDISAQTNGAAEDVQAFQSSFPPVGTNQNEVRVD